MLGRSGLLLLLCALSAGATDGPRGKFQCRRYPAQESTSPYGDPVAYIWFHPHGVYELLDLTTTRGKVSGRYAYDRDKREIDWTSGDLSRYIGHELPEVQGIESIRLNTRKDPEGRVDGTLRCLRVPKP